MSRELLVFVLAGFPQTVAALSSVLINCTEVSDRTHNLTVMWMKNDLEVGLVDFSNSEPLEPPLSLAAHF